MEFRTKIETVPSINEIGYDTPVIFMGSCFAGEIGRQFAPGKMRAMANPFGVLYNPSSVAGALDIIMNKRLFGKEDLYYYNNRYISFFHDTGFSSPDPEEVLDRINSAVSRSESFLAKASYLFVTFGTAWIYKWKENGQIVSNCHKIPDERFSRQILSVEEIVTGWDILIEKLKTYNNNLKIVFTVSPVRHLKDGAHENQLSKSTLLLSIDELITRHNGPGYFPSYEIVMDELRDYRFYKNDMVHPSGMAVDYIWEKFRKTYFSSGTEMIYDKVEKITRAMKHKITGNNKQEIRKFKETMLSKINALNRQYPLVDLEEEKSYFSGIGD